VIAQIPATSIYLLAVSPGQTEDEEAAELEGDLEVSYSDPNFLLTTPETDQGSVAFLDPSGPVFLRGSSPSRYYTQAAYVRTNAHQAQSISTGRNVIVAVVDTGISPSHPVLSGRISPLGFDFVDNDPDPTEPATGGPSFGHGTFIAGIIALLAPDSTLLPLRAMDATGRGNAFAITAAIRFAVNSGARVINLSLGMEDKSDAIDDAIDYAVQNNVVVVVSAGNRNRRQPQFPANESSVAAIAAVDDFDVKANFSNHGSYVSVSAPGVDLYSAFPGDRFAAWSGTSFAAPLVAGQAALLLSLEPKLRFDAAIRKIQDTSVNIDGLNPNFQGQLGRGRIDIRASLN